ncbi:hypothetical protein MY11210_000703 [Beauveria gryllotalpidicola]
MASMRTAGWNVLLTIGADRFPTPFAGIHQNPRKPTATFGDLRAELALCFECKSSGEGNQHNDSNNTGHDYTGATNAWEGVAFVLTKKPDNVSEGDPLEYPQWVAEHDLDTIVPGVPSSDPINARRTVKYHIVRHAKCAQHLLDPGPRRHHPAYLPYNKTPTDSELSFMPLRRRAKARSQSPLKRNASDASSPGETLAAEDADSAYNDMLAPASMEMDGDKVRKMISDFRMACIAEGQQGCAISGAGARWCNAQSVGPGIQACHIVPQQHYHVYPIQGHGDRLAAPDGYPSVKERLKAAWLSTWSPANGILLMKHIHDFFDARLVSIHPETLLIRVFVPYDYLEPYHGRKARLSDMVHRLALRHHYDMCCIENMAARRPSADVTSPTANQRNASGASLVSTGASTPFSGRTDLPATAGYITPDNGNDFLASVNWKLSRFKTRS